jgi:hypothetical protein
MASPLEDLMEQEVSKRVKVALNEKTLAMDTIFAEKKALAEAHEMASLAKLNKMKDDNAKARAHIISDVALLTKNKEIYTLYEAECEARFKGYEEEITRRTTAIENAVRDCSDNEMISVNIGGTVFHTLKSTLSDVSPFFANIYSDRWRDSNKKAIRDREGNIFINRPSKNMDILINWAMDGAVPGEMDNILANITGTEYNTLCRTLDYFGIDYKKKCVDELVVGSNIKIYWRGEKKAYNGVIIGRRKRSGTEYVSVKYGDGDTWEYSNTKLNKSTGPFKDISGPVATYLHTKWWHYGPTWGSTFTKPNPVPSYDFDR